MGSITDIISNLINGKTAAAAPKAPPPPWQSNQPIVPPPAPAVPKPAVTAGLPFPNPLIDDSIATVLTQRNNGIATAAEFNKERFFRIYVPEKLATSFFNAPAASKPSARVSLLFGVGPELSLFGLRDFFKYEENSVVIIIPGVESGWTGITQAFAYGITDDMIKNLFKEAGLDGINYSVEIMAGYSTGYRGVGLTVINKLVDLTKLKRLIYLDAWYHYDDQPLTTSGPFIGKNTQFAIDTAFTASPSVNLIIYGLTPGGVPRTLPESVGPNAENPPKESIKNQETAHPGQVFFTDFSFKYKGRPGIADALEKICLARVLQRGEAKLQAANAAIPAFATALIGALPVRGEFGTLGFAGFTDIYGWIGSHASPLSAFNSSAALTLINTHDLYNPWTDPRRGEMQHRTFLLEMGKEPLVPS